MRWLTGVWRGSRATGDLIWTQLSNGSMAGMWRRAEAPAGSDRFYTIRDDGTKLTLVEVSPVGVVTRYEAIEQGERSVTFSNPARGQLRLRGERRELDLAIQRGPALEHHHYWLEI